MQPTPILVHFHIFKNAGTTVDWILDRNFKKSAIKFDHGSNPANIYPPSKILEVLHEHPDAKSLSSHQIRFPLPATDAYQLLPIVFIRHPIDRAASVHSFAKKNKRNNPITEKARASTMAEFFSFALDQKKPAQIKNIQTRWLSQRINESDLKSRLLYAIENLKSCSVLGVVDRMDESLVLAEEVLKPHFKDIDMSYISQNISKERADTLQARLTQIKKEIGEELWLRLYRRNEFDLKLHSFAREYLDKRISQIDNFPAKLDDFKRRCARLHLKNQKTKQ